jgi:hypothetical protein
LPARRNRRKFAGMNLIKERSCAEIVLFIAAVFGIWLSIWAVIFVSAALEVVAVGITLVALIIFALRGND